MTASYCLAENLSSRLKCQKNRIDAPAHYCFCNVMDWKGNLGLGKGNVFAVSLVTISCRDIANMDLQYDDYISTHTKKIHFFHIVLLSKL